MYVNILIAVWVATGLLALFACYYIGRKYLRQRFPKMTKRLVTQALRRHGALREWKVLANVTLGQGEGAIVVDQLAVGPFGVLVVCDLYDKGDAYGDLNAKEWLMSTGKEGMERKTRITSPYYRGTKGVEQLRQLFAKEKIYSVSIELAVVKTLGQGIFLNGSNQPIYDLRALKALLESSRFEKDNKVDVARIAGLFTQE